jgi:hypothetical protein
MRSLTKIWKVSKKKKKKVETLGAKSFLKSNKKIQLKATPADWNKWKTEFNSVKTK